MRQTCLALFAALVFSGNADASTPQPNQPDVAGIDASFVRLWTPTTTNIFKSPGLFVRKIDGQTISLRTVKISLPAGDHDFEVRLVKLGLHNLLCGALCDSIFNKPKVVHASTQAGHYYTFRYVNDENGTVIIDDRGTDYDPRCLEPKEYKKASNC